MVVTHEITLYITRGNSASVFCSANTNVRISLRTI
jgi:hypothetical protein